MAHDYSGDKTDAQRAYVEGMGWDTHLSMLGRVGGVSVRERNFNTILTLSQRIYLLDRYGLWKSLYIAHKWANIVTGLVSGKVA